MSIPRYIILQTKTVKRNEHETTDVPRQPCLVLRPDLALKLKLKLGACVCVDIVQRSKLVKQTDISSKITSSAFTIMDFIKQ